MSVERDKEASSKKCNLAIGIDDDSCPQGRLGNDSRWLLKDVHCLVKEAPGPWCILPHQFSLYWRMVIDRGHGGGRSSVEVCRRDEVLKALVTMIT